MTENNQRRGINHRQNTQEPKRSAFSVSCAVNINLDINLALAIGDFIVEARPHNPAIMAFGFQLRNLVPPLPEDEK